MTDTPTPTLQTRGEVAAILRVSERTLIRRLPAIPNIVPIRPSRNRILFTPADVQKIIEAMECPFTSRAAAGKMARGTPAAPSASVKRRSSSQNTAQDAYRALTQTRKQQGATPKPGKTSLAVLPGGRGS